VLFPVLALLLALLARWGLQGWLPLALFKLVVPVLVSLVVIRLTVRVLHRAFPTPASCAWSSAACRGWPGSGGAVDHRCCCR
jgi:uncharacterized membrane protein